LPRPNGSFHKKAKTIGMFCAVPLIIVGGGCGSLEHPMPSTASVEIPYFDETLSFRVDEGTWMNLDVTMDGSYIEFDLLGDLYRIPATGGKALPVRVGPEWTSMPIRSPDGSQLAYLGDQGEGVQSIWVKSNERKDAIQVTAPDRDVVAFSWSADGNQIFAIHSRSNRIGDNELVAYSIATGEAKALGSKTNNAIGITRALENGTFYFARYDGGQIADSATLNTSVYKRTPDGHVSLIVENAFAPRISPDESVLTFARQYDGKTSIFGLSLSSGSLTEIGRVQTAIATGTVGNAHHQAMLPRYDFSPSGQHIFATRSGKLVQLSVDGQAAEMVPFFVDVESAFRRARSVENSISDQFTAKQLLWLDSTRALDQFFFSAGGLVWAVDLDTEAIRRLSLSEALAFEPELSPNEDSVAYVVWRDKGPYEIRIAAANGASEEALIISSNTILAQPAWSRDGRHLYYLALADVACGEVTNLSFPGSGLCESNDQDKRVYLARLMKYDLESAAAVEMESFVMPIDWTRLLRSATVEGTNGDYVYYLRLVTAAQGQEYYEMVQLNFESGHSNVIARLETNRGFGSIAISPNGERMAFVLNGRVRVYVLDRGELEETPINSETLLEESKAIGPAGQHLSWLDEDTLLWAFGNRIYSWQKAWAQGKLVEQLNVPLPRNFPSATIAFVNATIVTMQDNKVIQSGTIVVRDGRIQDIGKCEQVEVPEGAFVVDVSGKTIIPGLVDTHAHPHSPASRRNEYYFEMNLNYVAFLAHGVTTIFDPQASLEADAFAQAEMVSVGSIVGPRIYTTGTAIFGSHTNQPSWFHRTRPITKRDLSNIAAAIKYKASNGVNYVKSYNVARRDWRQAIVQAAQKSGLGITTEGGGRQSEQLSHVLDGHTATEHNLPVAELYDDVVQLLARTGVFYTPTLTLLYGGLYGDAFFLSRADIWSQPKVHRFTRPADMRRIGKRAFFPDSEQALFAAARSINEIILAGGRVTIGGHHRPYGLTTHWEMQLFALGGVAPMDVLRAATLRGAEKLGLEDDIGSLEKGKIADLLVLNSNPLVNVSNTLDIEYVVKGGVVFHSESMTEMWPAYKPLPRPFWHSDEDWERLKPERPAPWEGVPLSRLESVPGVSPTKTSIRKQQLLFGDSFASACDTTRLC